MAIDTRIPLAGTGVELGRSALSGAVAGNALMNMVQERQNAPLVREAAQMELESGKIALTKEKALEQLRRAAFDIGGVRQALASGDPTRAAAQLRQRKADIIARDGAQADTSHTDGWIAAIESGDPAQLQAFAAEAAEIERTAQQFGVIPAPAAPAGYANIKTDAQGRVWGTNPQTGAFEQIPTAQGANFSTPQTPTQPQLPASAIQLFERWSALNPQATPEQSRAAFDNIVRAPQMVAMGGGGQASFTPLSGTVETVVPPEEAAAREQDAAAAKARGKVEGSAGGKNAVSAPARAIELADMLKTTDSLLNDKRLGSIYGAVDRFTPTVRQGSINTKAKVENLVSKLSLEERQKMVGQGQISDFEGKLLAKSVSILNDFGISEDLAREEIGKVQEILMGAQQRNSAYLGEGSGVQFLGYE